MDVREARRVLGVGPDDGWDVVRAAYRRIMRQLGPELTSGMAGAVARSADVHEAYAILSGVLGGTIARGRRVSSVPRLPEPPPPVAPLTTRLDGSDTLVIERPDWKSVEYALGEAFSRLLEAASAIGSVSYFDRSVAIFEVIVNHADESQSLVMTLQVSDGQIEGFGTLESLEQVKSSSPEPLLRQLADLLQRPSEVEAAIAKRVAVETEIPVGVYLDSDDGAASEKLAKSVENLAAHLGYGRAAD